MYQLFTHECLHRQRELAACKHTLQTFLKQHQPCFYTGKDIAEVRLQFAWYEEKLCFFLTNVLLIFSQMKKEEIEIKAHDVLF